MHVLSNSLTTKLTVSGLLFSTLLVGCITTAPNVLVIPHENGQMDTMGQGKSKMIAMSNAMSGVNQYCGAQSAMPVVTSQVVKYNGIVDEQTGKVIEGVANTVKKYTGIKPASIERDDDYEATLTFYCKK